MSVTLLFRGPKKTKIETITLDATTATEHSMESEVTEFPVEDGSVISDHIIHKPRRIMVEGLVSDTPVQILGSLRANPSGGVAAAFAELERLHSSKALITVTTPLKAYKNCAVESIICRVDSTTGRSLPISCRLVEVRRVSPAFVDFAIRRPTVPKAQKSVGQGRVGTPAAPTPEAARASILKTLLGGGT